MGNMVSGLYSTRVGINAMILYGTVITCAGMAVSAAITLAGFGSAWVFFGFCTFVGLGNGLVMPNASAGMLSVRPELAGTASGLGSAILIGGGAALSAFAGIILLMGSTALPLQLLMLVTSALSFVAIRYVIRREKQLQTT
jgi:DHA1 family bicyclomycin/chloramphenicol resistance-like MFS transporter